MPGIALSTLALLSLAAFPADAGRKPRIIRTFAVLLPLAILFGYALVKFALLSTWLAAMASAATLALSFLLALPFPGRHPAARPIDAPIPTDALSTRESEVIAKLLSGSSQEDVAAALGIRPSTVGTYRRRALERGWTQPAQPTYCKPTAYRSSSPRFLWPSRRARTPRPSRRASRSPMAP